MGQIAVRFQIQLEKSKANSNIVSTPPTVLKSERKPQVAKVCGMVKDASEKSTTGSTLILLRFPISPFLPGGKGREQGGDGCHGVVL